MSKFKNGTVKISNDIFNLIAKEATKDVDGVKGLTRFQKETDGRLIEKDVHVSITTANKLIVEVHVEISLDYNVKEVCQEIQDNIKEDLEMMTGLEVQTVNVIVEKLTK